MTTTTTTHDLGHAEQDEAAHVHDLVEGAVPDRLPGAVVKELSKLRPGLALAALAQEWLTFGAVFAAAWAAWSYAPHAVAWALYPLAVVVIGARQHAMAVLGHDAAHYRFLPHKRLNDWVGNFLIQWPIFISVEGFRRFHGKHHQHLGAQDDGNRFLWKTHAADGNLTPEWRYPKTLGGLLVKVARRAAFLTGLFWIVRGVLGSFLLKINPAAHLVRLGFYGGLAAGLTLLDAWVPFLLLWIVPYCTWHVAAQYLRLIAEHSAIHSPAAAYAMTRTTIPPLWERALLLPLNIGYHIEHHWYPSVPFYNLPALHARLMEQPGFKAHANIQRSLLASLRQCVGRA